MASTSASSVEKSFKYDVFLSFRGEDTRKTFVDHLYHALDQKSIITYKDDEKIQKGKMISDQLLKSIEESRFLIIVFSKNYASSSWCLEELVKIMECQKTKEQTAYPIFFDVEPTEVRNQSGAVGEAFAKHVEKEEAGRWRDAMIEAAGLAGRELKTTFDGHEAKFIQIIVQDISLELRSINSSNDGKLIGMESRVEVVLSSLETGFDDVRMIGIKGMGGGGKTTLARAIFDQISGCFDRKSFVENVREVSKGSSSGLKELQKQILSDVLNDESIVVKGVYDGKNMMKKRMCSRKVLVVLDDVDDIEQLEALAGECNWFKAGSRIIITTRDKQVLEAHRVQFIHDVNLLSNEEALCLFSRYAFGRETPVQGYEELSRKVVRYVAGLPLTIKVLGSSLCGNTEREWEDVLERLKTIPEGQTLKRLELSYNALENDQKEIFLDIACILKGHSKNYAIKVLESCGFRGQIGLRVLEQKSLVTISHGKLLLHDHIEEMGMNIVRRPHPEEPNRHNRLWIKKEIEYILDNDLGTKAIRSIKLGRTDLHPAIIMKGFRKMKELRFLYVDHTSADEDSELETDQVNQYLPNTLQYLHWSYYPFRCLPKTFQANNLVCLKMHTSKFYELWEGGERKVLNKLRFLDLAGSMLRTFDLGMTPNLEDLDLSFCTHFVEIKIPFECPKLKIIDLSISKVSNLNLGMTPSLVRLDLAGCEDFVELHMPNERPKLTDLILSGSKMSSLTLGMIPSLKNLDLGYCKSFVELHMPVECPKLKFLNLGGSMVTHVNLGLTPCVETLNLGGCIDFVELHMPVECPKLTYLNLSGSKVSNLNLVLTPNLESLYLQECSCLQEIHAPVGCLKNLVYLNLSGCLRFEHFLFNHEKKLSGGCHLQKLTKLDLTAESLDRCPLHPNSNSPKFKFNCKYDEPRGWSGNLEKLISFGVCACTNLESFSASICGLQHITELTLEGSIPEVPKDIWQLERLQKLSLSLEDIKHLPDSICMLKQLRYLILKSCWLLEQLPMDLGRLQCLEVLDLTDCIMLRDIPYSICNMIRLECLLLPGCRRVEILPEDLGNLGCLNVLNIEGSGITHLPQSIFQLKFLCILWKDEYTMPA